MRFGSGARAVGVLSLAALWPDSVAAFRHSAVVRTGRGGCLLGPASHARQLSAGAPRRALTVAPRQRCTAPRMLLVDGVELSDALLKSGLGGAVGFVLGLLGGGGGILALPIFLNVFHEPSSTAIPESLLVVAVGAGVALLAKLKDISLAEVAPLAGWAALGACRETITAPAGAALPPHLPCPPARAHARMHISRPWHPRTDRRTDGQRSAMHRSRRSTIDWRDRARPPD